MKKTAKRLLSLTLTLMIIMSAIACGFGGVTVCAATFADLNQSSVWIKQSQSGPCVLDACAMMIRRTLIGTGNSNWSSVTESSLKGTACVSGSWSVYYSFDYMGVSVRHTSFNGTASSLKSILDSHPEGIVLYSQSKGHAVLVTDYSGDTFYCADPAYGDKRNLNSANQGVSYSNSSEYWYVSSPSITLTNDTTPPTISNLRYAEQKINGFRVECNVSDNVGVTMVSFPTWTTANGQDDLIWHDGTVSNGKASVWIDRSNHNNEFGTYVTDVYVYDAAGNSATARISTNAVNDTTGPKISHINVTNVTSTGYTISCTVKDASPSSGINSVLFPTWTANNGQDDLTTPWPSGSISGSTATYKVKYSEHNNETGMYNTHIYAYDNYGNYTPYNGIQVYPTRIGNMTEGKYVFQSALDSNKVIDVADPIAEDASNIQLWDYTGDSSQIFEIKKNGAGYTISPICSEYNLDAWGAKAGNDVNIAQTTVNNDINQTWQFESKGNGYYTVTSIMGSDGNDYVFDVAWKETANGTNIQLCKANGGDNQQFKLLPVYTVSYNANGGSGAPSSQYKVSTKTLKLSSTKPTRSGYTFLGWSTSSSATSATYSAGANYTANSGATLYAVWQETPTTFTLTYNANGGSGAPANQTGNGNITLSSTRPTRSGYTFKGWATSSTATSAQYQPGATYNLTANVTLYAVWEQIPVTTYTLTYNANGGSGAPANQTGNGSITLSSTKPTRSGYTFKGWATSSSATTAQYQPGATYNLTANVTLYAVWEQIPVTTYTLTYNANGGSGAPVNQTGNGSITLSSTKPTRSGYTFKKWNTKADGSGTNYNPGATYNLTANATLYAVWEQNSVTTYTLTYDTNGGYGRPASQTGNGNITLSNVKPERDGYTFKCWNTNVNGAGTSYSPGATYNLTANATLYAVWQKNETPENPDNPDNNPTIQIRNFTPVLNVPCRATVKLKAEFENAPEGATVHWFDDGVDSLTSETCTITNSIGTHTIQAKLISKDGEVLAESGIETIVAKSGFFSIIIAFFKALFGLLPVIEQ